MLRLMAVCTGNVCRSPLAEVLLRARLGDAAVEIVSAGVRALAGHPMTPETAEIARENGADEEQTAAHRAHQLDERLLDGTDLVLAMSREHRTGIVDVAPHLLRSTFTLREFARLARPVSDAELTRLIGDARGPRRRLQLVVEHLSEVRGTIGPPPSPADDDVPDPYRRGPEAYERSAAVLIPAVDETARVIRIVSRRL